MHFSKKLRKFKYLFSELDKNPTIFTYPPRLYPYIELNRKYLPKQRKPEKLRIFVCISLTFH